MVTLGGDGSDLHLSAGSSHFSDPEKFCAAVLTSRSTDKTQIGMAVLLFVKGSEKPQPQ